MENLEQQQQRTLGDGSSNEASRTISPEISNAAAQVELLRAEQLSLQHNSQLAFYAQAKARLGRSTTFRPAFKPPSVVRPQSLLLSNKSSRPG